MPELRAPPDHLFRPRNPRTLEPGGAAGARAARQLAAAEVRLHQLQREACGAGSAEHGARGAAPACALRRRRRADQAIRKFFGERVKGRVGRAHSCEALATARGAPLVSASGRGLAAVHQQRAAASGTDGANRCCRGNRQLLLVAAQYGDWSRGSPPALFQGASTDCSDSRGR